MLTKIKNWYKELPDSKRWLDLLAAVLTIPVLLTVIISNVANLKKEDKSENSENPRPIVEKIIITEKFTPISIIPIPTEENNNSANQSSPSPTPTTCNSEPQPIEITYPAEGEKVADDPVSVVLTNQGSYYCTSIWAYRINNSSWSTYTDAPIYLYNMAGGSVKLEVRVKSTVSGQEKTYIRNFIYKYNQPPSITATPAIATPTNI